MSRTAHTQASTRATLDLPLLVKQGERWITKVAGERRLGGVRPLVHDEPDECLESVQAGRVGRSCGVPRWSVVARDWVGGFKLTGERILVLDAVRPLRSNRMVMGRMRLPFGRVLPFGQAGLGLWRADPDAIAVMAPDVEYALTVGTGVEVRVTAQTAVGIEADYTGFYRDGRGRRPVPAPHVLVAFAAAKAEF